MVEFLIGQFFLWFLCSIIIGFVSAVDDDNKWLYEPLLSHLNIYNFFNATNLRVFWVWIFTIGCFVPAFIFRLWMWINALPFKFVWFILTSDTSDILLKKIFFKD